MIRTIIFDINGVISRVTDLSTCHALAKFFGKSEKDIYQIYRQEVVKIDDGSATTREFLSSLIKQIDPQKSVDDLDVHYRDMFQLNQSMFDYAVHLSKTYEIATITNFGDYYDYFSKKLGFEEIFQPGKIFVSHKLRMVKPHKEIYLYALKSLGRKPQEIIFIDDKEENVRTAKEIGMRGIRYTGLDDLKHNVDKILSAEKAGVL